MVGRDVVFRIEKKSREAGEVVLSVKDLKATNNKGIRALNGVTLNLQSGEIVGLAGVAGNGQHKMADVITGLRKADEGQVVVQEEDITNQSVKVGINHGISHIPEDELMLAQRPI